MPAKQAIAKSAIKLIKTGETIFLDTGTTTLEIARLINDLNPSLTVVTNSLPVAVTLASSSLVRLFLLGGFLRRELLDFADPFFWEETKKLTFTQTFLGVDGISSQAGLTTTDMESARFEEAVMARSQIINIVADASKIGRISLVSYGHMEAWKKPRRLITDIKADRKEVAQLRNLGFEVILAKN